MRKNSYAAGLGICLLLCACSQQKPIRLLADAEIVSTDSQNQTITVRDAGETTVFGEHGTADCSKAALSLTIPTPAKRRKSALRTCRWEITLSSAFMKTRRRRRRPRLCTPSLSSE